MRFTDCGFITSPIPPINRWAIFIRRLRRLLRQSSVDEKLVDPEHLVTFSAPIMEITSDKVGKLVEGNFVVS